MTISDMNTWLAQIPKVELHVHLEGSVQPKTLLALAHNHNIHLPAQDVDGLRKWYEFKDFNHFIEVYVVISSCLKTADDIEQIAREFLAGQAEQNILYSEVTFTPYGQWMSNRLGFREQMDAVNRARAWAVKELGVKMGIIVDIPRVIPAEEGNIVASWVIEGHKDGIIALGLGGPEVNNPPERYKHAYDLVHQAGIPCILHAGETAGPKSMWGAIRSADTKRIGHGVHALEDPALVEYLQEHQIPLEVCPSSNVCLKIFPSIQEHVLPKLLEEGLYVTINSDDPPMFNTTLTREYQIISKEFGFDRELIEKLVMNAVQASLLPVDEKQELRDRVSSGFKELAS
jgi:adenosine deaminase